MDNDWEPKADYRSIGIPEDDDRASYEANERRADLYDRLKEAGGPDRLPSYRDLGKDYGVGKSTIGKDMKEIRRYILYVESDPEKLRSKISSKFDWALEQAQDEGDYDAVRKILKDKYGWLADVGMENKEPEKHKIEHKQADVAEEIRQIYKSKSDGESE